MLKMMIQLFAEGNEEEQTPPVVQPTEVTTPFKAFSSEEEFSKFTQSISSKAKGEILKEIGASNVGEVKEKLTKYVDLETYPTKYTELETKYTELLQQNEKATNDLLLTKYNVHEDFQNEFLTLAKAGVNETVDIQKSAEALANKLGNSFFKNGNKPKIIIGGDQTPPQETNSAQVQKFRDAMGLK